MVIIGMQNLNTMFGIANRYNSGKRIEITGSSHMNWPSAVGLRGTNASMDFPPGMDVKMFALSVTHGDTFTHIKYSRPLRF